MVALYVLLGFILLLVIDAFVIKAEKKFHPAFTKQYEVVENVLFDNISVTIPADSYISKGHTWAELQGNGLVKVGVDEFALKTLGKFIVTNLANPGRLLKKGDPIIQAKIGEKRISFHSPLDGTVSFINDELIGKSISDAYGEDWGVIVSPVNFDKNANTLKSNEGVVQWLQNEFIRLKFYLIDSMQPGLAGVTMLDGGRLVEGAVSQLDQNSIQKFEENFLKV